MLEILLTLHAIRTKKIKWWVDRTHGVHPNCRGHVVAKQSLVKGSTSSTSIKQNLINGISNDTKLVVEDAIMPHAMCTSYFWVIKDTR